MSEAKGDGGWGRRQKWDATTKGQKKREGNVKIRDKHNDNEKDKDKDLRTDSSDEHGELCAFPVSALKARC